MKRKKHSKLIWICLFLFLRLCVVDKTLHKWANHLPVIHKVKVQMLVYRKVFSYGLRRKLNAWLK